MPRTPQTTSDLIASVRLRMFWPPDNENLVTNQEILDIGQDVLGEDIWPAMQAARENLLASIWDIQLRQGSSYDEPTGYGLPPDGTVTIEDVSYVDENGASYPLSKVSERDWQDSVPSRLGYQSGNPHGYFFRGSHIHVVPHPLNPVTGERVRVHMQALPLEMREHSSPDLYLRLASDPALNSGDVRLTVDDAGLLSGAWGSTAPITYDLIALSAAAPHIPTDFYARDNVAITEGSDVLDVDPSNWIRGTSPRVPGRAAAGDYIVSDYRTPILQIPSFGVGVLRRGIVAELAEMRGDKDKYKRAMDRFMEDLEKLPNVLTPRTVDAPVFFLNRHSPTHTRVRGW